MQFKLRVKKWRFPLRILYTKSVLFGVRLLWRCVAIIVWPQQQHRPTNRATMIGNRHWNYTTGWLFGASRALNDSQSLPLCSTSFKAINRELLTRLQCLRLVIIYQPVQKGLSWSARGYNSEDEEEEAVKKL